MAAGPDAKPFNPRDRSPTLVKLLKTRLAPVRERELMAAAKSPERPVKPAPGDCCGSSCHPCVMDNYADELRVWKECWVKWDGREDEEKPGGKDTADGRGEAEGKGNGFGKKMIKMPGAFEW